MFYFYVFYIEQELNLFFEIFVVGKDNIITLIGIELDGILLHQISISDFDSGRGRSDGGDLIEIDFVGDAQIGDFDEQNFVDKDSKKVISIIHVDRKDDGAKKGGFVA